MVKVEWQGKMAFQARMDDGTGFLMDAGEADGGEDSGPSPVQAFLASAAACSAMDVISILRKMRQEVHSYRVEVEHERTPKGEWPRPVTSITLNHFLTGKDLDPEAVAKAVELSDTKYCSVAATLRLGPELKSVWKIEPSIGQ
jgi:putative redox protein